MHEFLNEMHIKREFNNLKILIKLIHDISELFIKFMLIIES